jgi:hypothetical protein
MVIFGAGASYDSCSTFTDRFGRLVPNVWRPPLADELFSSRFADQIAAFPQCLPVITNLQQRQGTNVERFLETMYEASGRDQTRLRQLVAIRFYLQNMLTHWGSGWKSVAKGVSNYLTLIDEIRAAKGPKERVCLVTFNYDTLLEDALPSVNVDLQRMSDYIAGDYPVFKLHGSVNWGRVVNTSLNVTENLGSIKVAQAVIEKAPELNITEVYELVKGNPTGLSSNPSIISGRRALFPALAIPMQNKFEYECPKDHQQLLKDLLPHVSKVLVVGWRAAENQFLQTLKTTLGADTEFMIVSSGKARANAVIDTIRKAGVPLRKFFLANGGFTSATSTGEIDDFLKR